MSIIITKICKYEGLFLGSNYNIYPSNYLIFPSEI